MDGNSRSAKEIGIFEAKARISDLVRQVEAGEEFVITRHGRPVAVLSPVSQAKPRRLRAAIDALEKSRQNSRLGAVSLKDLINEGRE